MIIKIDPLDTLFFRDGKPFTMGEDTWANGVFPPYPSVIYGALRSTYFANHIDKLERANKIDDPTKNLEIKGIYYLVGNDIYLPLPLDCVKEKETKRETIEVEVLKTAKNENPSSCPTNYIFKSGKKVENVLDGLVRKSILKKYLSLPVIESFHIQKISDCIVSESKIGITIGKSGSSEDGKLYRVDMKRLINKKGSSISIIVDFEGLDLSKRGMMKLGGEGKAVSYEKYSEDISFDVPAPAGKKFKLYLSTPAIFKNGWLPEWIDKNIKGLKLKLLTASIGKPIYIGGFDMKAGKPKTMYKAVPAGSVYYFEIIEGNIQNVIDTLHKKSISDHYKEQGFGIAFVGKILGKDDAL